MKGGATGFIGFLAGPWGAVILGAGMILGTLVSKSMESKKATNDLTSSLDVQKLSTYELIDAINKKADAEAKANKTSYEAEVANYNVARSLQVRTIRELEAAKAIALKAKNAALSPAEMLAGGGENLGAVGAAAYEKQVVELDAALKKANETVRGSLIPLVKREAVAAYDAAAAATLRYAKTEATLDANYHNHKITYDLYRQGLLQLSAQREKDQESVRGSANSLVDAQARMEASTTHLSEAQAHLALVKAQAARIKDPTSPAAIKLQEELAGAYRDVASARQAAIDDRKAASAAAAAAHHAQALARDASAMDATAQSGFELARAYLGATDATVEANDATEEIVNTLGAAVIAEARHRAASEATKKGIDQEAQTRRVLANMIADGAVQAGKTVYQLRTETSMRNDLNAQLEAGKISLGEYNEQMKEGAALKPLIDLQAAAKAKHLTAAYELLTKAIEAMKGAMGTIALAGASRVRPGQAAGQDEIERLKLELKLIGATNEQRAVELAMLAKKQQLRGFDMTPEQQKVLIDQAGEIARQTERNNAAQDHNKLLTRSSTCSTRSTSARGSSPTRWRTPSAAKARRLANCSPISPATRWSGAAPGASFGMIRCWRGGRKPAKARAEFRANSATAEHAAHRQSLSAARLLQAKARRLQGDDEA
jgi:hypothetical protein